MIKKRFLFSLIILLTSFAYSQIPEITKLNLKNKQSILNGRAFLLFPSQAVNAARGVDIMSVAPSENQETRIILDIENERIVFFAEELYVTSRGNLLSEIPEDASSFSSKLLTDKDSLLSVLITPLYFDTAKSGILINTLMVKTQDNSVFRINAYINKEAFKFKAAFLTLSEKTFETLSKGNRNLNYKARTETIPVFDSKKSLEVQLPEGFILTKIKGDDFDVVRFQKVRNMSDTNWLSLTLYMGNYPSYFYPDYDFEENKASKINGYFLQKKVSWLYFKSEEKQLYLKEQQIPTDDLAERLIIHIAMSANQPPAIEELTKIVESIKISK